MLIRLLFCITIESSADELVEKLITNAVDFDLVLNYN
jgi:hypothetical protein